MTPKDMRKKAIVMMAIQKFHCSQAIAAVGQEKLGIADDNLIRAMGAFGGGLGGNGEICGALAGGLAVLGLRFSRARQEEKENPKMWKDAEELVRQFREEIVNQNSSILCRDISQIDWKNRQQVKAFYTGDKVKDCVRIVGETAKLLGELLEQSWKKEADSMKLVMNRNYKISDDIRIFNFDKVAKMLQAAFWSEGIGINEVRQGAANSALVVGAFTPEGNQIGYARAISDKTCFAYILDVYVDEQYRKQKIGQSMIKFILNHASLRDVYQWILITKDAHGVYGKVGFKQLANPDKWMEIRNPRPKR
jgi:C_GCAxxG_C_C family probable redox protein